MFFDKYRNQIILALITVLASLFFWLLFILNIPGKIGFPNVNLETIYANYDGPNYLVVSKCWYNKECIGTHYSLPQPLEYYPAHLPGYPFIINFLNTFLQGPKAMLLATLIGSVFLTIIFYDFLSLYLSKTRSFWLSVVLLFLPARLLILRQIGAPETWFIAATITSIYFFKKNKYWPAAVFAAVAQIFKSPGILLFAAYGIYFLYQVITTKNIKKIISYLPFLLVPLTVLVIFYFYLLQTGDFFAYFHSGDNFHLNPLPYLVFISNRTWINTIWLEDIIYIFLLAFYGLGLLFKKYRFDIITIYTAVFIFATVLVAHRDISRYIAPVYPFLLLSFQKTLNKKSFKIIFLILIPALILYAVNFIAGNTAPIADWTPYL